MNLEDPYEGQKFKSFEVLKKYLEEYGQRNFVKFWIRSSHTISSLKSKSAKKMNPELKYVCMKFACIFGGEKIRRRGSGIRKSSTYRNLGCPCKINAVVGEDGNHVKLETVVLEHNHALCKSLYDSLKKSKNKILMLERNMKSQNSLLKKNMDPESYENPIVSDCSAGVDVSAAAEIEMDSSEVNQNDTVISTTGDLETKSDDNFHDYLKTIQKKYGSNIKIIVVKGEESERTLTDVQIKDEVCSVADMKEEHDDACTTEDFCDAIECAAVDKEICRLCMSASNKLTPIFKPSLPLESTILSFKIMSCASIEISNDDHLPSNICTTCEKLLDIAYNFRIKCENSDSVLRKTFLTNRFTDIDCPVNGEYPTESDCERKFEDPPNEIEPEAKCGEDVEYSETVKQEKEPTESNENEKVYVSFDETCPICGVAFETYSEMLRHMEEHSDVENFLLICNLCNVLFTTVKSLLEHMKEHVLDINNPWMGELISCSRCDLNFLSAEEAKVHEDTHLVRGEEEGVNSEDEALKERTSNAPEGYLCNVCGKIMKSKDRFQSHRNMHEGLRPHICSKCGRGFADRKNMHQHYDIVHLRKAKHECPICHKKFYAPTKMKSHITMHYGVKPFSCDVCHKTFRLRMNMIKHKKTHSNERPHKCDKCNASFIYKNLLTRHSYVHGGIRPYVCPFCGHRFTVKFNLKKHLRSGRCNGKCRVKGVSLDEYSFDEWVEAAAAQPENTLPNT